MNKNNHNKNINPDISYWKLSSLCRLILFLFLLMLLLCNCFVAKKKMIHETQQEHKQKYKSTYMWRGGIDTNVQTVMKYSSKCI